MVSLKDKIFKSKDTQEKDLYIKRLEDKIKELRSVIDKVPGNFYWKDLDGKYLGCNDSVIESLTHIPLKNDVKLNSSSDIVGKNNYDLFEDDFHADVLAANDNLVMSTGEEQVFVESFSNRVGGSQYWLSKKAPHVNELGETVGLIGSAHDITIQKKLEKELKIALEKSKSDAKAKEDFIDSLSHDIRTPLAGIIGLIEYLEKNTKGMPDINEKTKILNEATKSFLNFFNEILATVEDVDVNENKNKHTLVNLKELIAEFENIYRPAITNKNLEFNVKLDKKIAAHVEVRKEIVVKIITNLIGNAIKFTEKGRINFSINSSDSPGYIEIIVSDTGIGIAPENIEKLFDRFTRNFSNRIDYKGTGLGLYMVNKYVDSISGTLHVESELGVGTSFKVVFPVKYKPPVNEVVTVSNSLKLNDDDYDKCSAIPEKNILIIEDNDLAAFALDNMIKEFKHKTTIASTAAQAIEELKNNSYDLIFLDQDLPDANGVDLITDIRAIIGSYDLPIIILSGHIGRNLQAKLKNIKCQGLFVKPMQVEHLVKILNKYLVKSGVV
ncbi:MAG: response regulator [Legionellales bacterium]|nr:response regulator [Legionellales bacterium]